jgi:3-oxoacyl-[acyl-carrier-protein] synthase-3
MFKARVLGTGMYVPPRVVTNHELSTMFDTSDEWIVQRTGIQERRYAEDGVGPSDLAVPAARQAIENAGLEPSDIEMILFATMTPDYQLPGCAPLLQRKLGLYGTAILDIRNQCSGFVYGLSIAQQFIATGMYRRILLVGAENHSCALDFSDEGRDVTVLFGDGAGAVVLGRSEDDSRGILATTLHGNGAGAEQLAVLSPGCNRSPRIRPDILSDRKVYPQMDGRAVFHAAVDRLPEAMVECLDKVGMTVEDLSMVIPHQANLRINRMVSKRLNLPNEKVFNNIHKYGNTTAASIPIALHEAIMEGYIHNNDLVMMAGFGAGFTWGAALIRW